MSDFIEDADGSPIIESAKMGRLFSLLRSQGGHLGFGYNPDNGEWLIALVFGKEAEDSDMAGGASYALGDLPQCIDQVLKEVRA